MDADSTELVLSHAHGNAARDGTEDEECNNSCGDDTTSESGSSVSDGEKTYDEESFEVLCSTYGRHPTHKLGMREPREGEAWVGGLTLILSVGEEGGLNLIFA